MIDTTAHHCHSGNFRRSTLDLRSTNNLLFYALRCKKADSQLTNIQVNVTTFLMSDIASQVSTNETVPRRSAVSGLKCLSNRSCDVSVRIVLFDCFEGDRKHFLDYIGGHRAAFDDRLWERLCNGGHLSEITESKVGMNQVRVKESMSMMCRRFQKFQI
mmetsp:Transcript_9001/g.16483  ORF Transcript_9001/g.16483 Transcript_9001/m.16483 type:complete len:159 (-) Transcript_9001:65-541(-)